MIYEVRGWYGDEGCLYTDDRRVRDIAAGSSKLRVSASYFRTPTATQAFAWDITGPQAALAPLLKTFSRGPRMSRTAKR